jgi:hypothetical protein
MGTATPQHATIAARCSDTLSPTPPLLCLSTFGSGTRDRSATTPLCVSASVYIAVSVSLMPRMYSDVSIAASWYAAQLPSVAPRTNAAMSSRLNSPPSRFRARICAMVAAINTRAQSLCGVYVCM